MVNDSGTCGPRSEVTEDAPLIVSASSFRPTVGTVAADTYGEY